MEIIAARRTGGGISVQTLLFVVALLELFWLVEETRGDFANGILFFLQEQLNPFCIGGFTILFTATYFLGRNVGKEILISGKSFVWVELKYSFLTLGILSAYLVGIYSAINAPQSAWKSLPTVLIRLIVLLVASGIWSGWRIKRILILSAKR